MTTLLSPAQVCAVPTTLAEPCPVVSRPTKTTGRPSPREAMAYQASATTVTRAHLPAPCDLPHLHPSALADFSALAIPSLADWHYHAQPCHACATVQFFAGLRIPGRLSIDLSAPHRSAPVSPAPIDLPRRSPPCPPRTDLSSPAIPCPAQAFRLVPSGRTSPSPRDPAHQHAPGRSTATRQHLSRRPSSARRAYHDRYRANSYLADKLFRACSGHRSPSPADCACHAVPSLRQSTNPATLTRPWPCRHAAPCPPDPGRLAIAAQGIPGQPDATSRPEPRACQADCPTLVESHPYRPCQADTPRRHTRSHDVTGQATSQARAIVATPWRQAAVVQPASQYGDDPSPVHTSLPRSTSHGVSQHDPP